jgi:hypothetical protein
MSFVLTSQHHIQKRGYKYKDYRKPVILCTSTKFKSISANYGFARCMSTNTFRMEFDSFTQQHLNLYILKELKLDYVLNCSFLKLKNNGFNTFGEISMTYSNRYFDDNISLKILFSSNYQDYFVIKDSLQNHQYNNYVIFINDKSPLQLMRRCVYNTIARMMNSIKIPITVTSHSIVNLYTRHRKIINDMKIKSRRKLIRKLRKQCTLYYHITQMPDDVFCIILAFI